MRRIILFILIFASCSDGNNSNNESLKYKDFVGVWQKECEGEAGRIEIYNNLDSAIIEVNSNQIIITTQVAKVKDSKFKLLKFKLKNPYDLGSGGMRLSWKKFSRDSPVARMKLLEENKAEFKWFGFYNENAEKKVWENKIDLLSGNRKKRKVKIQKCDLD